MKPIPPDFAYGWNLSHSADLKRGVLQVFLREDAERVGETSGEKWKREEEREEEPIEMREIKLELPFPKWRDKKTAMFSSRTLLVYPEQHVDTATTLYAWVEQVKEELARELRARGANLVHENEGADAWAEEDEMRQHGFTPSGRKDDYNVYRKNYAGVEEHGAQLIGTQNLLLNALRSHLRREEGKRPAQKAEA